MGIITMITFTFAKLHRRESAARKGAALRKIVKTKRQRNEKINRRLIAKT